MCIDIIKTELAVNSEGSILYKAPHAIDSRHDYAIYKLNHPNFPQEVEQDFDLGYQGVKSDYPDLKCAIPFKKKGPVEEVTGERK